MVEKKIRENLLAIADAYAKATGLALSTVSGKFHGKTSFLAALRAGECSLSISTVDAMLAKFSANWPSGAIWPKTQPVYMHRPKGNGRKSTGK